MEVLKNLSVKCKCISTLLIYESVGSSEWDKVLEKVFSNNRELLVLKYDKINSVNCLFKIPLHQIYLKFVNGIVYMTNIIQNSRNLSLFTYKGVKAVTEIEATASSCFNLTILDLDCFTYAKVIKIDELLSEVFKKNKIIKTRKFSIFNWSMFSLLMCKCEKNVQLKKLNCVPPTILKVII